MKEKKYSKKVMPTSFGFHISNFTFFSGAIIQKLV